MHCEFCSTPLPTSEPENLALLAHIARSDACHQQFRFMLENLNSSWTPAMSGG